MDCRPYPFDRWPRVTRAQVAALGRGLRSRPVEDGGGALGVLGELLGSEVTVRTGWPQALPEGASPEPWAPWSAALALVGADDGARAILELDSGLALAAVGRALGAPQADREAAQGPPSEGERGVLAYLAARALARAGSPRWRVAGVMVTPEAVAAACGGRPSVVWTAHVQIGAVEGPARLLVADAGAPPPVASPITGGPSLSRLPLTMVVEAGRARLPLAELRTARPGDVVVLDEAHDRPGRAEPRVRMRVAGGRRTCWWCIAERRGLRLERAERTSEAPAGEGRRMTERQEATAATIVDRTGDAPVEVTVELARFTMPLEELGALQPGEVVRTGRAIGEHVVLRAGEQAIGTGELVDVEGEVGVRILELT